MSRPPRDDPPTAAAGDRRHRHLRAFDRLAQLELFSMQPGLDRIEALLDRLDHPERRFPVVLVAGTNGKGSSAALLASVLGAGGYGVGLFTSPHLESVRERFRLDGVAVTEELLVGVLEQVLAAGEGVDPTYFEVLTAVALVIFSAADVDLGILEVGLGGRLDATNATMPLVSIITSIAVDHAEYLGRRPEIIAREKAGIMRCGREVVVGHQTEPEVSAVLRREAARAGSIVRPAAVARLMADHGLDGQQLELAMGRDLVEVESNLAGAHQRANLGLVATAAAALAESGFPRVDLRAVADGVASCRWPARLESLVVPGTRLVFDGAHNPSAIAAVEEVVRSTGPFDLVFGAALDKDAEIMARIAAAGARRVVLTGFDHPRAALPTAWRQVIGRPDAIVTEAVAAALDQALRDPAPVTLVTGSLFLVGEARRAARQRFGSPAAPVDLPVWLRRTAESGDRAR